MQTNFSSGKVRGVLCFVSLVRQPSKSWAGRIQPRQSRKEKIFPLSPTEKLTLELGHW